VRKTAEKWRRGQRTRICRAEVRRTEDEDKWIRVDQGRGRGHEEQR